MARINRDKKTSKISVMFTATELEMIKAMTISLGMSISQFIRHALENTYGIISRAGRQETKEKK